MLGILPILIQWLALSQIATRSFFDSYYQGTSLPPKSHWTLLNELQKLGEDEIERYLPQVCNMVLDRDSLNDPDLFNYFENILVKKCADCLPFGSRISGYLKVTSQPEWVTSSFLPAIVDQSCMLCAVSIDFAVYAASSV